MQAYIDKKDMQFLFKDENYYHFMDVESYDQVDIEHEIVGDALRFVKENEMVKVCSKDGSIFSIEAPLFAELPVKQLESSDREDIKIAVLENGASVDVPDFVNVDDVIKIDTRTGEYITRV